MNRIRSFASLIVFTVLLSAPQCRAIIIHDLGMGGTPQEYIAFAAEPRFQASGYLEGYRADGKNYSPRIGYLN